MKSNLAKQFQSPKLKPYEKANRIFLVVMLTIPLLHWLIFWFYVNIQSIILSFKTPQGDWTFLNFSMLWYQLQEGGEILLSLKNTLIYFGATFLVIMPSAFLIAYFFFKRICGYKVFRIIFYLPAIISSVVMVKVFSNTIAPRGPLGAIMEMLGHPMSPDSLLGQSSTATWTIVVDSIGTGPCTSILLFNGALSRVSIELFESAKLDGCGLGREIINLIVPLTWPTISTMIIFNFTGIFSASGPILLFQPEGANDTSTLAFWIFKQVYGTGSIGGSGSYGLVSATGLVFTLIGVPIILFVRWLMEKIPNTEY